MKPRISWLVATLLGVLACTGKPSDRKAGDRDAWAVGTTIGGNGLVSGPPCTYAASADVAELVRNDKGEAFMAKLIGPGSITETCPQVEHTYDVVEATGLRVDGPDTLKVGEADNTFYSITPVAGERELRGVHRGGEEPIWALGDDCEGVARFDTVQGSQDTGGRDITRKLIPSSAGTCTISVEILDLEATKVVTVR